MYFEMSIKKLFIIFCMLLFQPGCDFHKDEKLYRRQINIESNLSVVRMGYLFLDSSTTYPYVLEDRTDTTPPSFFTTLTFLPVNDSGFILLNIFGCEGFNNPPLQFKDSTKIITPIDTLKVLIQNYQFIK